MGGFAEEPDDHAVRLVAAEDDADVHVLGVEDRPLLDVQLEVRIERPVADLASAGVAGARELSADGVAVAVGRDQHVIEVINGICHVKLSL